MYNQVTKPRFVSTSEGGVNREYRVSAWVNLSAMSVQGSFSSDVPFYRHKSSSVSEQTSSSIYGPSGVTKIQPQGSSPTPLVQMLARLRLVCSSGMLLPRSTCTC